jgi:signal transduction histidine kinase
VQDEVVETIPHFDETGIMKKRLLFISSAFALSLVIILILSDRLYRSFESAKNYSASVDHTYKVILKIGELENFLKEAETAYRGYLLTSDSSFVIPYLSIRDHIKPGYDSLRILVAANKPQMQLLNKAGLLINDCIDFFQHSIYLYNSGYRDLSARLNKAKNMMVELQDLFKKIEEEETKPLKELSENKDYYESTMPRYFVAIFVFAFVIFIVSFIVIIREFRQRYIYQKELEQKISEINAYTAELEQIAFATSHDLQEPLRRIQTFSDRLINRHSAGLDEEGKMVVSRIEYSARRMQGLVEDLMSFTNLVRGGEELQPVPADTLINEVVESLGNTITASNATLHIGQMPVINGYRQQLFTMFRALLDNAIKFCKPGVAPIITIQWVKTNGEALAFIDKKLAAREFIKITVQDNGIGFSDEFNRRIFLIFQRLHVQAEYEGKGIGLAMVERIMANHNGYVTASGVPGKGAEFSLYFPVPED